MSRRGARPERVQPVWARQALEQAHGHQTAAYSRYILLARKTTGSLAPGCDNADLQEWYRQHAAELPPAPGPRPRRDYYREWYEREEGPPE